MIEQEPVVLTGDEAFRIGYARGLDELLALAKAILTARRAEWQAEAVKQLADRWQHGEWANAPRCANRVQERIANAQHVTDWLRGHADRIKAGGVR